jgi:hypothetical protein
MIKITSSRGDIWEIEEMGVKDLKAAELQEQKLIFAFEESKAFRSFFLRASIDQIISSLQ